MKIFFPTSPNMNGAGPLLFKRYIDSSINVKPCIDQGVGVQTRNSSTKTVGIFYASAGNGHKSAALALQDVLDQMKAPVEVLDVLSVASPLFRWSNSSLYDLIALYSHFSCKVMYRITDLDRRTSKFIRLLDWNIRKNMKAMERFLDDNRIKSAICTHFFPATYLCYLKQIGKYDGQIHMIVTDYGMHRMWFNKGIDTYFVPSSRVCNTLEDMGVEKDRIILSGIPLREKFSKVAAENRNLIRAKTKEKPLKLLIIARRFPTRRFIGFARKLCHGGHNLDIEVIAGNSSSLLQKLKRVRPTPGVSWTVHGFVDDMEKMMARADILLTKTGGLTISEAIAMGLPVIGCYPIPFQEVYNGQYLERNKAGVMVDSLKQAGQLIKLYQSNPGLLRRMRSQISRIGRPRAAECIAEHVLNSGSSSTG